MAILIWARSNLHWRGRRREVEGKEKISYRQQLCPLFSLRSIYIAAQSRLGCSRFTFKGAAPPPNQPRFIPPKPICLGFVLSLSLAFGRFYTLLAAAASIETSSRDESFSQHDTIDGRGRKKGLLIKPS